MSGDNMLLSQILDSNQKGIYIVDSQKRYIYSNKTFLRIIGVSREELIGKSVYEFRDKGKYDTCVSDIVFREKNNVSIFGNVVVRSNGVIKNERFKISAMPTFDRNHNIEFIYVEIEFVHNINLSFHEATARTLASVTPSFNTTIENPYSQEADISVIAQSPQMRKVLSAAKKIANVDANVLISGSTGTGKGVIAEYIHENSIRKDKSIIVINCATIPENLLESTFFGYEKGSFSGALSTGKSGLIEQSDGGTLFLDEINSLPLDLQGKILRVIETKKVRRVGSNKEIPVDFRLISATNESIEEKILDGTFRSDLYYRINILPINLPRLADRREDIIPLTRYFTELYTKKYNRTRIFSSDALDRMFHYDWPGNVRELRNVIERAIIMTDYEYIDSSDMDFIIGNQKKDDRIPHSLEDSHKNDYYESLLENNVSLQEYLDDCEKKYLSVAFNKYRSTYKVASALSTNQSLIARRKKKYDL